MNKVGNSSKLPCTIANEMICTTTNKKCIENPKHCMKHTEKCPKYNNITIYQSKSLGKINTHFSIAIFSITYLDQCIT